MAKMSVHHNLKSLFEDVDSMPLTDDDRIVIFSDLHMGNGGRRDDFLNNSSFFNQILERYYLDKQYKLILNGDIEELHRFRLSSIMKTWHQIYETFEKFKRQTALFKIIGNHDYDLVNEPLHEINQNLLNGMRLDYRGNCLFIFHGHQSSNFFENYNEVSKFLIRYLVNPLGIKGHSTAYDNNKKHKLERKIYGFSRKQKIVSIIGHTHRPLFESLSKIDYIKFEIEKLCRIYPDAKKKIDIERNIRKYKQELEASYRSNKKISMRSSLYDNQLIIPCLYNSGCVIGKRGFTGIEFFDGKIALVHWFDVQKSKKYFHLNGRHPQRLGKTDYYRTILKEDYLDYTFTRIKLLT